MNVIEARRQKGIQRRLVAELHQDPEGFLAKVEAAKHQGLLSDADLREINYLLRQARRARTDQAKRVANGFFVMSN